MGPACLPAAQLFHAAGLPKGLISCVTGKGSDIGDFLTQVAASLACAAVGHALGCCIVAGCA